MSDQPVVGYCDGLVRGLVRGWAWQPLVPDIRLEIELLFDGAVVARGQASAYRRDLREAGIGDGCYSFEIPMPDPGDQPLPDEVQVRAAGGAPLNDGRFPYPGGGADLARLTVQGYCDGIRGGRVRGWAWHPERPDIPVEIEVRVDGEAIGSVPATRFRADLRAAGIGTGRFGFEMMLPTPEPDRRASEIVVAARGGQPLNDGVFTHALGPTDEELANPAFAAFLAEVAGTATRPPRPPATPVLATHIIVHAAARESRADAIYPDAAADFRRVLARLGPVHDVADEAEIDRLNDRIVERGETALALSFGPPGRTPIGLRCPVVPLIAWDHATLPIGGDDSDRGQDWRMMLRHAGRAIALSNHAAGAIRRAMGAAFPVAAVPIPMIARPPLPLPSGRSEIAATDAVFDSRDGGFSLTDPLPEIRFDGDAGTRLVLTGIVFAAVVAIDDEDDDGWRPIVDAFTFAHRDNRDATLLLLIDGADARLWWRTAHERLGRLPAFSCRIVFIHGTIADVGAREVMAASHWAVNGSRAAKSGGALAAFMAAGRPAIAPAHTALADFVTPATAIVVATSEIPATLFGGSTDPLTATAYRPLWSSLKHAFTEAYRQSRSDPEGYRARGAAARRAVLDHAGDDQVAAKLDAFLGLCHGIAAAAPQPALVSGA